MGRRWLLLEVSEMLLFACLHTCSSSFRRLVRETSKNRKTRMNYSWQIHRTTARRLITSPVWSLYDEGNQIKKRKIKWKYMWTVSSSHMSRVSPASRLGVWSQRVCVWAALHLLSNSLSELWRRSAPSDGGGAACTFTLHPSHDSTSELLSTKTQHR